MHSSSSLLLVLLASLPWATALRANANSPCAAQCGNTLASTIGTADIVCHDSQYAISSAGVTFQGCTSCQLASTYVDPETHVPDLQWALYNMRYAVSWCLWGYPNRNDTPTTPCLTSSACGPLEDLFTYGDLASNATDFGYCQYTSTIQDPKCSACLAVQETDFYLTNFLSILDGACTNQPTSPNQTITIQGNVFSTTQANVTAPTATAIFLAPSGLSLAAKVGIAVAGVVVLLVFAGFLVICLGRRRRRRFLARKAREQGWGPDQFPQSRKGMQQIQTSHLPGSFDACPGGGSYHDSPQSQQHHQPWSSIPPLHTQMPVYGASGEEWTPISPSNEGGRDSKPFNFSPYSSLYSSPVSARDGLPFRGREWPLDRKASAPVERSRSREKGFESDQADRIELRDVAPAVLRMDDDSMGRAF